MKLKLLGISLGALALLAGGCSVNTAPTTSDKHLYVVEHTTILFFTLPPVVKVCDLDGGNCRPAMK